jgi:hypothetical protein
MRNHFVTPPPTLRDSGNYKIAQNGVKIANTGGCQNRCNLFTVAIVRAIFNTVLSDKGVEEKPWR